jgi:hypothetical protein
VSASDVVNMRCSASLRGKLDRAAEADKLRSSTWVREVVVSVLATGLSLPDLQKLLAEHQSRRPADVAGEVVLTGRRVLGRRERLSGGCLHPLHLREHFPTFDRCRAEGCGQEFPR